MKPDYLLEHLAQARVGRREVLRATVGLGAAGVLASLGLRPDAAAGARQPGVRGAPEGLAAPADDFNDTMFDVAAVLAGAWDSTAFYQKGDQRGTYHEVTPAKTAAALSLLEAGRPVVTYQLGDLMFNGYPAFVGSPPRLYEQRLTVLGYQPKEGFGGVLSSATPLGKNKLSIHEERFKVPDQLIQANVPYTGTYQIGTQLDNLNHIGVGDVFYGGHRGADIAAPWGTTKLGGELMGPIVTRGVVVDVLSLKQEQGATGDLSTAGNGKPLLKEGYRITVEDIEAALRRQKISAPTAGDVVLFRTGWNQLVEPKDPAAPDQPLAANEPLHPSHPDHKRYLSGEPGIFLREARYLAARRPAIVGGDTWGLEVLPGPDQTIAFPVHQELLVHYGIRIAEAVITDRLVDDKVYEFVYIVTPQNALGATAGNTPPAALGQPRMGATGPLRTDTLPRTT
jgi:kynurenine formamidase